MHIRSHGPERPESNLPGPGGQDLPAGGVVVASRPRVYGTQRIDPAKRAGQRRGRCAGEFDLDGEKATKKSKTFVAIWRPAGRLTCVAWVDEPTEWRAYREGPDRPGPTG